MYCGKVQRAKQSGASRDDIDEIPKGVTVPTFLKYEYHHKGMSVPVFSINGGNADDGGISNLLKALGDEEEEEEEGAAFDEDGDEGGEEEDEEGEDAPAPAPPPAARQKHTAKGITTPTPLHMGGKGPKWRPGKKQKVKAQESSVAEMLMTYMMQQSQAEAAREARLAKENREHEMRMMQMMMLMAGKSLPSDVPAQSPSASSDVSDVSQ